MICFLLKFDELVHENWLNSVGIVNLLCWNYCVGIVGCLCWNIIEL